MKDKKITPTNPAATPAQADDDKTVERKTSIVKGHWRKLGRKASMVKGKWG